MWVVGIGYKEGQRDPPGNNIKGDIIDLGFSKIEEVKTLQTYIIEGDVKKEEVEKIGKELLTDSVIQYFKFDVFEKDRKHAKNLVGKRNVWIVEVFFRPGVMDAVGLSVEKALEVLGIRKARVRTGTTYVIDGKIGENELKTICKKALANDLIQTYRYQRL